MHCLLVDALENKGHYLGEGQLVHLLISSLVQKSDSASYYSFLILNMFMSAIILRAKDRWRSFCLLAQADVVFPV